MSAIALTDQERAAFARPITKDWSLDYFYNFDNVPLHFAYGDGIVKGERSELEQRNEAITRGFWMDAYNLLSFREVVYQFLYRPEGLMLPLQAFLWGARQPLPTVEDSSEGRRYRTVAEIEGQFAAWMADKGRALIVERGQEAPEDMSQRPGENEWPILLGAPDRMMRLVSVTPFGNQVIAELLVTWSEEGILKETPFGVILLFDVDGTVLIDRSYCDLINWPTSPGLAPWLRAFEKGRPAQGQTEGALDRFLSRYQSRKAAAELTPLEKRNQALAEGPWAEAFNSGAPSGILHPGRYRRQLPLQKLSYSFEVAKEAEAIVKQAAPDRKLRVVSTFAKGNQVVAECIMSWTDQGTYKQTPFLAFLVFDNDGLVIRDRSYININHWPGGPEFAARFGVALYPR